MNNSGFAIALGPVRKKNNGAYKPRAYDPDGTVAAKRGGKIVFERAHRNEEHSLKHYKNISREVLAFMKEHNLEDVPPETFFRKNGRSDLVSAARTYFGGILGLRAEMVANSDLALKQQ